jgi:hypothetical protein
MSTVTKTHRYLCITLRPPTEPSKNKAKTLVADMLIMVGLVIPYIDPDDGGRDSLGNAGF